MQDSQQDAVQKACRFIDSFDERLPTLAHVAEHVGLSPSHFQKLFKRMVGLSPRQYAESRRVSRVKALLRDGEDVASAMYGAGYGSSSRLYEAADATFGMTPATYRKGGAGAEIHYAFADCLLGRTLVAATARGVCFVAFDDRDDALLDELADEFPAADLTPDDGRLSAWVKEVVRRVDGRAPNNSLPLDVQATAFQWRVWRALTEIPAGETRTYSQIAANLGKPTAQRAVGRACATNPVSILVPCHRAVREDGGLAGYRWGLERKETLIEREAATAKPKKRAKAKAA
jgi:AraC family transcriptional regulator of adaptative response/methylated-DNA-[protein]-cysteine methyltransferase